jgi:flavin-dependent dehydrogenase
VDLDVDVAIAGGGPAGATAALTLARRGLSVALIEGSHYAEPRVGETLPPWAAPTLRRLGLSDTIAAATSMPSYGNQAAWGGPELAATPFLLHPDGHGWHVIRERLDASIAGAAEAAGAALLRGWQVRHARALSDGRWRLTLGETAGAVERTISARAVVDATGRDARVARALGARRDVHDRLVGVVARYDGTPPASCTTMIEGEREGWWYSAPLGERRLVVAFMTDADLCAGAGVRGARGFAARIGASLHTRERVGGGAMVGPPRVHSSIGHRLRRGTATAPWLAAGDAALAVDPLSSSGITRALAGGEGAALALAAWLEADEDPPAAYERWLDVQLAEYLRERAATYALEQRWPHAPFWRRRQQAPLAAPASTAARPPPARMRG